MINQVTSIREVLSVAFASLFLHICVFCKVPTLEVVFSSTAVMLLHWDSAAKAYTLPNRANFTLCVAAFIDDEILS